MVLDPIIESIIAITICCAAIRTIYFSCIKDKYKKDDSFDLNLKKVSFEPKKNNVTLRSNESFTNLKLHYTSDDEENITGVLPIQRSFECFQCKRKLSGYYKKDFFAYDREYCELCWKRIHFKVINTRS